MHSKLQWISLILIVLFSCRKDHVPGNFKAQNLIIVFIDGARMSETWQDPFRTFIPFQDSLKQFGTLLTDVRNQGETFTIPGHVAVCTGNYQHIENNGVELPDNPSFLQYWLEKTKANANKAWIITSKDKLEVLSNCEKPSWKDKFRPSFDCGVSGIGSGYRHDSITLNVVLNKMITHEPNLVLVNFREPDFSGHQSDWIAYLEGIVNTDKYIDSIWKFIQNHPYYSNNTTLLVTNDHGRHNDANGGFSGHGDGCSGCRKLSFLALGPDIVPNQHISTTYNQLDLNATIGYLIGINQKESKGHIITSIFNK